MNAVHGAGLPCFAVAAEASTRASDSPKVSALLPCARKCRQQLEEGKWVADPRLLSADVQQLLQKFLQEQQGAAGEGAAPGQAG